MCDPHKNTVALYNRILNYPWLVRAIASSFFFCMHAGLNRHEIFIYSWILCKRKYCHCLGCTSCQFKRRTLITALITEIPCKRNERPRPNIVKKQRPCPRRKLHMRWRADSNGGARWILNRVDQKQVQRRWVEGCAESFPGFKEGWIIYS